MVAEQLELCFRLQPSFSVVVLTVGAPSFRVGTRGRNLTRSLGVGPRSHRAFSAPAAHASACLSAVAEVLSECRLLAYISQVPTQMSFLFRLINIIHVQTLTQVRGLQTCPRERGNWKQLPSSQGHLHPRSTSPVTHPFIPRRPSQLF